MTTSVLEQILLNVQSGTLLPLDVADEDPTAEIDAAVDALVDHAEAEVRRVAHALMKAPVRGVDTPARFRRALEQLSVREGAGLNDATNEPEQLEEIQTLLEELAPEERAPTPPRVPLEDIQSMIELLK
ncbi:MAG: hypothetical protein AAF488_07375 [Planctomycetota bacterium]